LARDIDVYEIKLGDEFLMSSSFTASETALAKLALAALPQEHLDILIGGLGTLPRPRSVMRASTL
jgi:hypothetical protein